jgi:nucleoid DNA-binding protein
MLVTKSQIAKTLKEVMAMKDIKLNESEANACVSTVFQAVKNALVNDGEVRIDGLGTLKRKDVAERKGHNPRTGEVLVIPAHKVVIFKTGKQLNEAING